MATERKIELLRIAHVTYRHKDMDAMRPFYADFGFQEVSRVGNKTYYRGYGTEPFVLCAEAAEEDEFGGPSFVVEKEEDLKYASETLPKATEVYELKDAPGGGKAVTFWDPVDGFPFTLVYGQTPVEPCAPEFPELKVNYVS